MATQTLPISLSRGSTRAGNAIVSPLVDFLIVGGLSFLLFPISLWMPSDRQTLLYAIAVAHALAFAINYPHFTFSYQILYDRYWYKLTRAPFGRVNRLRYLIAGVVAPVVLAGSMTWAVLGRDASALGYLVNAMFFFVGWHYVKQSYGILIVLSGRWKVAFDARETAILKANAYAVWLTSWVGANVDPMRQQTFGVTYSTLALPQWLYAAGLAVCAVCFLGFLWVIVRRLWRGKPMPPASALIGYAAGLYPWSLFYIYESSLIFYYVPLFHGLQYLLFVGKYQDGKARSRFAGGTGYWMHVAAFVGGGVALGVALFSWVPRRLDLFVLYDIELFGPTLFLFLFNIFINIHHYFIDNAIWRRDNPEMRYLFE